MLSCRKAAELTSQALDRRLSVRERAALRLHLALCRVCRLHGHQLELIRAAAARLERRLAERDERLDEAARERIRERLRTEAER